jgi:DNA repair photolyase
MNAGIEVKSILNKKKSRDAWFLDDYTLNPYSGCSFNCLYCYIRGSKYGEHMERKTQAKLNAVDLLEKQLALRARKKEYGIIVLSSATDPYLQLENELQLTRQLLEVILHYRFPIHVITKSDLVLRDTDLLLKINENAILPDDLSLKLKHKTFVTFSFSTVEDEIAGIFEPGATAPSLRISAMKKVAETGLLTGVSLMPLLPFISDSTEQLEKLFTEIKSHRASYLMPASLTLFGNENADSKTLVLRAIEKHFPHLLQKYLKWFDQSSEMPSVYRDAFGKKMKELSLKYNLPDRILTP